MLVATWNVNSIRSRLPRLLEWLGRRQPDVACLQETKVVDEGFPLDEISKAGYRCLVRGEKTYNGVAILHREPASDPVRSLPGDEEGPCRFLSASVGGVRIVNIYAPNGQEVGSPKYEYKLGWYARLRSYLETRADPGQPLLLCGDFNVAPADIDVWDPKEWEGQILFSEPEKEAFRALLSWGLTDSLRALRPEGGLYTWWDYRAGAFHRGWGLRIDHILVTAPLMARCASVEIDRNERKGEKPSDHAPVVADLSWP